VVIRAQQMGTGGCNPDFARIRPDVAAQINTVDTASPAFAKFRDSVAPVIRESCAFATCHSAEQSDFFLTCNDNDDQRRFNYLEVQQFISAQIPTSQFLLKPLAPLSGGGNRAAHVRHAGGDGAEGLEVRARGGGDDRGQGALPTAGRTPEDRRDGRVLLDGPPQHRPLPDDVLLPDEFLQRPRPHARRQRRIRRRSSVFRE